jgi:hypothetical protein
MIDSPIGALLDDRICLSWLERPRPAEGVTCPRCRGTERRLCRAQGQFPADRCRAGEGYATLLTGPAFEKTRQRPATLVLRRRGMAKGGPTARLAREVGLSRKQLHPLRPRLPTHLHDTAPTDGMTGTAFEADARDQRAGGKQHAPSRSHRSAPSPRH